MPSDWCAVVRFPRFKSRTVIILARREQRDPAVLGVSDS